MPNKQMAAANERMPYRATSEGSSNKFMCRNKTKNNVQLKRKVFAFELLVIFADKISRNFSQRENINESMNC